VENTATFHYICVDRNDSAALTQALSPRTAPWDLVVDVICYRPDQVTGLLAALQKRPSHIFVISSALIYDRHAALPLRPESPLASEPELGAYGKGKIDMESAWIKASSIQGWPVTILRLPHVLGAGCLLGLQPLHNRDATLLSRIAAGFPILLTDGGRALLQTVASRDVATIIFTGFHRAKTFGRTYNCVGNQIITGREYYEEVATCLDKPLLVTSIPAEVVWASSWGWELTTVSRIYDQSEVLADFGILPTTTLRESLRECVEALVRGQPIPHMEIDPLAEINRRNSESQRQISMELSKLAERTQRQGVDARMNVAPRPAYS
jgi:nucleoside-diphosphate-sugar epimerase